MEDNEIIELYFARNEDAISESDKKYGAYCMSTAQSILADRLDAEECVNDTWLTSWNLMPPQRPICLKLFFARITRNKAISRYRMSNAEKRSAGVLPFIDELGECVSVSSVEGEVLAKELGEAIERFLSTLPKRERGIFVRRYFFTESSHDISVRYGTRESNVNNILSRTRRKLKEYLEKEGYR